MGKIVRKGIYDIDFVLSRIVEIETIDDNGNIKMGYVNKHDTDMVIDGVNVYANSDRYIMFKEKGVKCSDCGLEGKYFALETTNPESNRYHFNLYAINKNGSEMLMTKDHIKPKAKGGKNHVSNYQPMCIRCNERKSDKY